MPQIGCRFFNGYKPCGLNEVCDTTCPSRDIIEERVLIIHLEALGAVQRSTALLPSIKRKYPRSHVTWLTKKPADALLKNLKQIDRILTLQPEDLLKLQGLEFDVVLAIDKSQVVGGILKNINAKKVYGFTVDSKTGAIIPATLAAEELWRIGLSDQIKFFENKKSEIQLATEALELPYQRDQYQLELTHDEKNLVEQRRREWAPNNEILIGLNTGCAGVIPYKKLTVEFQREIIEHLRSTLKQSRGFKFVLLGGPEDTARNIEIAKGLDVVSSPTEKGLRDGLCSVAATDIVITGDSLGMHMAIAAQKWVLAWFGPTCAHEIDLFDRGVHIKTQAACSPCWKRSCEKNPMCYDQVLTQDILQGVLKGIDWLTSSTKPHSSATSYLQHP
jgi:heptosyltransferase II